MSYNLIHDVKDVTDDSDLVAEPVSVQELKDWLRLEGFQDEDESPDSFDDEDEIIEEVIIAARQDIENACNISLVAKTLRVTLTNGCGNIRLPYGPVGTVNSLLNSSGDAIDEDNYELRGADFKSLTSPSDCSMVIEYEAGYTVVPKALKQAVLRQAAFLFTHRGDEAKEGICESAWRLAMKYNQNSFIV